MKHLFIALLLTMGTYSFAQTKQQNNAVGNEPLLNQYAELQQLAREVNDAHAEVTKNTSGSRAQGDQASATLTSACNAYVAALNKELAKSGNSAELNEALTREIAAVKLLMPAENKSNR